MSNGSLGVEKRRREHATDHDGFLEGTATTATTLISIPSGPRYSSATELSYLRVGPTVARDLAVSYRGCTSYSSVDQFLCAHGSRSPRIPDTLRLPTLFIRMQKHLIATDPAVYPQYNGYRNDDLDNSGHAWLASNPSEEPPSMSQDVWGTRLHYPSSFSFLSILESLKKLFYRRPFSSETHHFPPSFVRRTRNPLTSAAGPSTASTARFLILCIFWYTTSALSSNTGKAILEQFRYPVTLTIIQFGFVAACCSLIMTPAINLSRLRSPTVAILKATLPMGVFQVGGHMFSSMAISRIHVSTVHTIKVRRILTF